MVRTVKIGISSANKEVTRTSGNAFWVRDFEALASTVCMCLEGSMAGGSGGLQGSCQMLRHVLVSQALGYNLTGQCSVV